MSDRNFRRNPGPSKRACEKLLRSLMDRLGEDDTVEAAVWAAYPQVRGCIDLDAELPVLVAMAYVVRRPAELDRISFRIANVSVWLARRRRNWFTEPPLRTAAGYKFEIERLVVKHYPALAPEHFKTDTTSIKELFSAPAAQAG